MTMPIKAMIDPGTPDDLRHSGIKKKVLSFGAHPDDIEIGCGGTEALLSRKGYEIYHVYATSGEAGSQEVPREELRDIRKEEAQRASDILGARIMAFLEYPDGLTAFTGEMKMDVMNLIRSVRPDIVFIHSSRDAVQDHRVVHELVMSALKGAAGPWFQEAEGEPWTPETVLGYEVWHPLEQFELSVDITETIEKKIEALQCHRSQMARISYDDACKGLARYRGVISGAGDYAEVFEVIRVSRIFV